jgi:hypothetical protein
MDSDPEPNLQIILDLAGSGFGSGSRFTALAKTMEWECTSAKNQGAQKYQCAKFKSAKHDGKSTKFRNKKEHIRAA